MIVPSLDTDLQKGYSSPNESIFSSSVSLPSRCRGCKSYKFQGSRGGHCHKLGVGVYGHWTACSLAEYPFAISWTIPNKK